MESESGLKSEFGFVNVKKTLLTLYFSDVSAAVLLPLDEVHSNSLVSATETTDISG